MIDPDPDSTQPFGGHDPETGILTRLRHWTDVAPVLLLCRVMRMAGSPILVGSVWAAWVFAAMVLRPMAGESVLGRSFAFFILAIIAVPILAILMRQGALLTAGRDMASPIEIAGRLIRRPIALLVVLLTVPAAAALFGIVAGGLLWLAGVVQTSGWGDQVVGQTAIKILSIASVLVVLPAAVLLAGGIAAVPLAIAAMVNEPDPDPLDSLSRGYEYVARGWLPAIGLALVGAVLVAATLPIGLAISVAAQGLIEIVGDANRQAEQAAIGALRRLPIAWMTVVGGGVLGGIYLMLRRFTGGQEIEDIWVPTPPPEVPLPKLRTDGSV